MRYKLRLLGYYSYNNQVMYPESERIEEAKELASLLDTSIQSLYNNPNTDEELKNVIISDTVFIFKDKHSNLYAYFTRDKIARLTNVQYSKTAITQVELKYKAWFYPGESIELIIEKTESNYSVEQNLHTKDDGITCLNLCFYTNGSYMISESPIMQDLHMSIPFNDNMQESFLLQCYDNGCVNKVSVEIILNLRRDFEYSNGIYKKANIQNSFILDSKDYIAVKYSSEECFKYRFIQVSSVAPIHSILGLKGTPMIIDAKDNCISWTPLGFMKIWIIERSLMHLRRSSDDPILDILMTSGLSSNQKKYHSVIQWLECNLFKRFAPKLEEHPIEEEILTLISNKDYDKIKDIFDKYTIGKNITFGRVVAKNILSHSRTKEILWNLIKTLLDSDANIYIKPIVDAINKVKYLQTLKPSALFFETIIENLFAQEAKSTHIISLVNPYRDCINEKTKNIIASKARKKDLKTLILREINQEEHIQDTFTRIGEFKTCSVIKKYQNHYMLSPVNGLGVLLPKKYCKQELKIKQSIKVQIVHIDTSRPVIFVSEIDNITEQDILSVPLLNIGDIINISFYKELPQVHNCYAHVKIKISPQSKNINYNKKYLAEVINNCDDYFTYEVKLIESANS